MTIFTPRRHARAASRCHIVSTSSHFLLLISFAKMDEGTGYPQSGYYSTNNQHGRGPFQNPSQPQQPRITAAYDANQQRRITDEDAARLYPNTFQGQQKDQAMLHPAAYLPPEGVYFNWNDTEVKLPENIGDQLCENCFRHKSLHSPSGVQCTNQCVAVSALQSMNSTHTDHPGQASTFVPLKSGQR
jgi:hypothetical protein